jgi:flagellar protein FlaG
MPIQNATNMTQARPASDSAPIVVAASSSNVQAQPSVPLVLPKVAVKPAAEQQPSAEQLKSVVDNANRTLKQSDSNLEFTIDTNTKKTIVKLVESSTGELIRQYPTKEMLEIARAIDQLQHGAFLKQKA